MSSISVTDAVDRLNRQLPLAARQAGLAPDLVSLHRGILRALFETGRMPALDERVALLGGLDLVVFSETTKEAVGAYPMTTETTPHVLKMDGRSVYAMCALDALSVSAMFGGEVTIESCCRVTGEPVVIRQSGETIVSATPSTVCVGVAWQMPCGSHAAHSMCVEMVFLRDAAAAEAWHKGDLLNHSVFSLADAVSFGSLFFRPLVAG